MENQSRVGRLEQDVRDLADEVAKKADNEDLKEVRRETASTRERVTWLMGVATGAGSLLTLAWQAISKACSGH